MTGPLRALEERWCNTLASLQEHPLRVSFARSEMYAHASEQVALALHSIAQRAELSEPPAQAVLHAFVPLFVHPEHLALFGRLREHASGETLTSLYRLLRCATARGHLFHHGGEKTTSLPITGVGRVLSLGERRALARRPSRAQLDRLLDDPHPMVVRIVLANPLITEDDVVRMAARRPAHGAIAVEIASTHTRSRRVRMAIIQNPSGPPAVSVPLLTLLSRPELRQVARAANLRAVVRATAQQLWTLRPPLDGELDSGAVH